MEQAVAWWCLERVGMTLPSLIESCLALGYRGIELAEREDWPLIREHGLTIVSARAQASLTEGLNRPEHHDRLEREIRANLELAVAWGIPVLICFSGNRAGGDDEAGLAATADGLRRVARVAEDAGVTLALELLNSKVDHKGYQGDHTAFGVEVVRAVDSPRVKLLYDIYHMQIMEGDVIRTIRDNAAHIAHFHTGGVPGRHELDDTQELNYRAVARAIADLGFTGYVAHEFVPTKEPLTALREAVEICSV